MERKISVRLYAITLVITLLVFLLGIMIGTQISQSTSSQLQKDLDKLASQTYVLELLSQSGTGLCEFYESQVKEFDVETVEFGSKLDFLEKTRGSGDQQVIELKAQYSLKEVRDFLLLQRINNLCGKKFVLILYFYSNKDCPQCRQQG